MAVPILKVEKPRIQPAGLAYNGAQRVRSALNPQVCLLAKPRPSTSWTPVRCSPRADAFPP